MNEGRHLCHAAEVEDNRCSDRKTLWDHIKAEGNQAGRLTGELADWQHGDHGEMQKTLFSVHFTVDVKDSTGLVTTRNKMENECLSGNREPPLI